MSEIWQWVSAFGFSIVIIVAALVYLNMSNRETPGDTFNLFTKVGAVAVAFVAAFASLAAAAIID
ncbi:MULTISPECIES: hypothetical protein [Brucella/Ochrobactrum group]|uniref:Uncharacterized protein n=1 Tax=Brucella anthropi (strain ATCC 49188 / DSM 6882 / CCUG 24695 / JCM 21032 / LMG 3331 / NBRC 15819 / NCTC 12168 / Alc 37) TaxID=439375 RepID=A6X3M5_BRUA4|nr:MULTISPECIES: hypothetical protein [Brucella/Ochrobactrum group]ABS15829.1 hypothetical protein Oant_3121 [Brucella anthropi ATCC 49188]AIK41844.1 putative membrane protein [Brucella anthropi]KAB2735412.1 hypothetical protein F9K90_10895 [Brucella anthropi]KAB2748817.1 hypothetical protein F9L05_10135 [Brucella anthropi]KAB2751247.1 hypothetical protein F9K95_11420 [Brucella anthropi]